MNFMNRRFFFRLAGTAGAALVASSHRMTSLLAASSDTLNLVRFPEKAELILLTDRPPQWKLRSTIFGRTSRQTKLSLFDGTWKESRLP
jgi:hypothetical protein